MFPQDLRSAYIQQQRNAVEADLRSHLARRPPKDVQIFVPRIDTIATNRLLSRQSITDLESDRATRIYIRFCFSPSTGQVKLLHPRSLPAKYTKEGSFYLMEQRSKRRRLSQQEEPLVGYFESKHGPWPQLHHGIVVGERSRGHHEHLRKGAPNPLRITSGSSLTSNKSRPAGYATTHGDRSLPKVAPRGLGQDRSPEPPLRTAIASMVQVVVDLPDKSLTKLLVPPGSSIIPLQGYGTLTLDMGPSPSLPLPSQTISAIISSSANSPSPSAYPASSSMHPPNPFVHSASSAQQSSSQASRASIPEVSKTAIEPSYSITIAKSSPSSSPSLKINLPKPDSQIVLISPPSTPIPSNPPSSLLSDSADLFHFTSPVISSSSSYSSSRGTQSSSLLTSSQTIQPTHFMVSANGDTSSSSEFISPDS